MQRWLIGALLTLGALTLIWIIDMGPALTSIRHGALPIRISAFLPANSPTPGPVMVDSVTGEISVDPGSVDMAPHLDLPDLMALMAQEDADIEPVQHVLRVRKGGTLMELLTDAGIDRGEAHEAIAALKPVYDPRKLQVGQEITLTFGPTAPSPTGAGRPDERANERGDFVGLALQASVERDVMVLRDGVGRFAPHQVVKPLYKQFAYAKGTIQTSLYDAAIAADVPLTLLSEMVQAYSYDVDFQREIHPGDRFEVLFEAFVDENGQRLRYGQMLYALLTTAGAEQRLYRFTPRGGVSEFFNDKGHSVKKALLRTPIDGARLTSGFGNRFHPILGYTVKHRGVDFGAATGTPIMAAGDAVVAELGWKGGYGQYIRLRHTNEFSTAYAHLSSFARGISPGARVRQGQVIGYVGATGMATGPHLHYEVHRNGGQVNPTGVKFPSGQKLTDKELREFDGAKSRLGLEVARLTGTAQHARSEQGWGDLLAGKQPVTGCTALKRAQC